MSTREIRGAVEAAPDSSHRYLPAVDGLRAVAVLSVMLFHLDERLLPGGFIGVDVFFVISGYVISRSLADGGASSLGRFLLDFYKRRVLRIFPALLVCLLVTGLFSILFIPQGFWLSEHNARTGLMAFFGLSNFYLVSSVDGYFSARTHFNPFVHTWSLAVEEQFYLVLPLIFHAWLRGRRDRSASLRHVGVALPVLALLSFAWAVAETQAAPERAFYLLPSRFWELAAGVLLFQFQSVRPGALDGLARWCGLPGLVLLAIGFGWADKAAFPFPWAVIPVLGTVLLIIAATGASTRRLSVVGFLATSGMTYVGRLSYSLYLWHWPVFVLFRWTVGLQSPIQYAVASASTVVLAALSYHYIETGVRRNRALIALPSWKVVSAGAAVSCIAFGLMGATTFFARPLGLSLSVTRDACVWTPYDRRCATEPSAAQTGRSLFVVGDSHAQAYALMARVAAGRLGAQVFIRSVDGCPVARLFETEGEPTLCQERERETLEWLTERARPGDVVFLASLRVPRFGDQWGAIDADPAADALRTARSGEVRDAAVDRAVRLITALQARGLVVLIDAPKPVYRAPPFRCADWFNRMNPVCEAGFGMERERLMSHREPTMTSLRRLESELGVRVWDPFPVLCDGSVCSAFDGDRPVFFDGDHLSGHGNLKLVDSFSEQLRAIWPTARQDPP